MHKIQSNPQEWPTALDFFADTTTRKRLSDLDLDIVQADETTHTITVMSIEEWRESLQDIYREMKHLKKRKRKPRG